MCRIGQIGATDAHCYELQTMCYILCSDANCYIEAFCTGNPGSCCYSLSLYASCRFRMNRSSNGSYLKSLTATGVSHLVEPSSSPVQDALYHLHPSAYLRFCSLTKLEVLLAKVLHSKILARRTTEEEAMRPK